MQNTSEHKILRPCRRQSICAQGASSHSVLTLDVTVQVGQIARTREGPPGNCERRVPAKPTGTPSQYSSFSLRRPSTLWIARMSEMDCE